MAIEQFRGANAYLSNMFELRNGVELPDGRVVPCVEIAYLSERWTQPEDRDRILKAKDGYAAKRLSNKFKRQDKPRDPRFDTGMGKLAVMRVLISQKFERNPELAERLLQTGTEEIIEGNTWDDTFWGVSPAPRDGGTGDNHLGRIIMEERGILQRAQELQHEQPRPPFIEHA